MNTTVKLLIAALLGALVTVLIPLGLLVSGFWNTTQEELLWKYRLPNSRFVELLGAKVHYVDAGQGPPLVLVHGSYESLREWDETAQRLTGKYRVVRFDRTWYGLTEPDRQHRTEIDDDVERLALLAAQLHLGRFVVAGSSAGSAIAIRLTEKHPDLVSGVILVSAIGGTFANVEFRAHYGRFEEWLHSYYRPMAMHVGEVHSAIANHRWLTPDIQQQYHDMINRRGNLRAMAAGTQPRPEEWTAAYGRIRAPVLIAWGRENPAYPAVDSVAAITAALHSSARVQSLIYDGVGHKVSREAPERLAADIDRFMSGLDSERR